MSDWIDDEDWDAPPTVRTETAQTNNNNTDHRHSSSTTSYSYDDKYRSNNYIQ